MPKLSHKYDLGHWEFDRDFDSDDYFGFLYCIQNKITNQFYFGKKQFTHRGKKKSKTYGKEMKWRTYTGSSKHLNDDIKKYGKENFRFMMVDLYKTKGGLYYAEAWAQMSCEAMTARLECGEIPRYYNRQIAAIRFVPKEDLTEQTRKFVKNIKRRY